MTTLKQTFANAEGAVRFVRAIRPLVSWREAAAEEPCSVTLRLEYPLNTPAIERCTFRGIESIESRFKPKQVPEFQKAINGNFRAFLELSGSAHFIFRASEAKPRRSAQYSFSIVEAGLLIRFVPMSGPSDLDALRADYATFFDRVSLPVAAVKAGAAIAFKAHDAIRIETPIVNAAGVPGLVDCYLKDRDRCVWLTRLVREWERCGLPPESPEFSVSFPFVAATTEAQARKAIDALNKAELPIKSANCELYYTIDSALDLEGLTNLKKADRGNNTIEVTVAECVLPSKLKGFITVTARKSDLLVELHAQEAPDEDAFVKEARQVLKAHLK